MDLIFEEKLEKSSEQVNPVSKQQYFLSLCQNTDFLISLDDPEVLKENLHKYTELLGHDWEELRLSILHQDPENLLWYGVHNACSNKPSLIPIVDLDVEEEKIDTKTCKSMGKMILHHYTKILLENRVLQSILKENAKAATKGQKSLQKTLQHVLTLVDHVCKQKPDWTLVLQYRFVECKSVEDVAVDLFTSKRNTNRYIDAMYVEVGAALYRLLPPGEIQTLLKFIHNESNISR
ncbi:hypothetical protein [Alicyclobacillus tolerans]|uniref:Uncharacterized protein n=1 Tax=Alicyclobacillus tolerans TaxID=90970 RepID=A0A1M6UAD1_9BACL|nr:hypothetical protein [Alicyclobacillus montanus]SHK66202.1 hypothetical protein SAMN05443507_11921 [Alicyclobacillus montanus]